MPALSLPECQQCDVPWSPSTLCVPFLPPWCAQPAPLPLPPASLDWDRGRTCVRLCVGSDNTLPSPHWLVVKEWGFPLFPVLPCLRGSPQAGAKQLEQDPVKQEWDTSCGDASPLPALQSQELLSPDHIGSSCMAKRGGTDCTRESYSLAKVGSKSSDNQSSLDGLRTLIPLIIAWVE